MKILQPSWVHHDEKSIFSIDIHPGGEKFATGGQGNDSGRVVIWNLLPVVNEEAEKNKNVPRMLCQMDNHLACVNCVRWSGSGTMLASCADDKLIMIWKKSVGGSFFGTSKMAEYWRCISTLRGHAGDVLDLAWSPQDRFIASCSVDNTVIIWDAKQFPTILQVMKGHTGLVKGVTWDPVGKFVASQSDDRTLKIWKTSNFSLFKTITEPFEECGGTTHILRLSWSPDGQYLVSAHAMNGGGPTAQIIERDGWKCDKDFVGHRKAVTCVRFHNSILKRTAPKTNKSQQYCCLAVGARDKSLSVWLTALQRPLVVIHDLFQDSILDLSWSHDGYILLACSGDGHVACLQFSAEELGTPLSEEDKNSLYQRMYENAEFLKITQNKLTAPSLIPDQMPSQTEKTAIVVNKPAQKEVPPSATQSTVSQEAQRPILKQIETKTADGKRRITPMFIPLNDDAEAPASGGGQFSSSSVSKSNIITVEMKADPIVSSVSVAPKDNESAINDLVEQTVKLDVRLKKRVPSPPRRVEFSPERSVKSSSDNRTEGRVQPQPVLSGKASVLKGTTVRAFGDYRIQLTNDAIKTGFGALCRVVGNLLTVPGPDKKIWETVIGSPVVSCSISKKFVVFCSVDGSIRFADIHTGAPILPIMSLTSPVLHCTFSSSCKLGAVLTENCTIRVWDLDEQCIFLNATCQDIMGTSFATMLHVSDEGVPFIILANGASFSYCKKLESWLITNSSDPIMRHGLFTGKTSANVRNMKSFPLTTVQCFANAQPINPRSFLENPNNGWQTSAMLAFVENQIKLAEMINSPREMQHWYLMLGFQLAQHGTEAKVRQVLDQLLGTSFRLEDTAKSTILGISKYTLFEEILDQLKTQPKWQRIYTEYSEQLKFRRGEQQDAEMTAVQE
ncbi:protein HIRA homolog isoform X2 [Toxorhynchites rutilus septentrionalis]|uniref:protein HIRA homolog isoform X2 n=1 Tax=Toxorhynchites rutilus septentrionalis TaxID=329112 RepID=UPI002478C33E|nr:protein HIRA homolog isoform X2 [Toxorhynchites rutilus septentrionalis]